MARAEKADRNNKADRNAEPEMVERLVGINRVAKTVKVDETLVSPR